MENYLTRDDIWFHPHADSSHSIFKIDQSQPGEPARTTSRSLSDSDLCSIADEKQNDAPQGGFQFRLLLTPPTKGYGSSLNRMPYSRDAYESLAKDWNIPASFPLMVRQHVPVGGLRVPSSSSDRCALILKSEVNWPYQFALCISRTSRNTMNCLCIGLSAFEASSLIDMLSEFAHLASQHDLLVPICLLSLSCHELSKSIASYHGALWRVQKETGLYGSRANKEQENFRDWNFNHLTKRLTGMADTHARALSRIATLKRIIGVVEEILEQEEHAPQELRAQMQWVKQTMDGSEHYVRWFQGSSTDQMKTITHFTQQYDNYLNMQLVQQSNKDGTSMGLISLVTLVFLPGTFAATLFSTSFFDFKPNEGSHVSWWFWLYWVITAGLTMGVMGVFWWMVRKVESGSNTRAGKITEQIE